MKKSIFFFFFLLSCIELQAQVFLGIRDSRYFQAGYQFEHGTYLNLEHSAFSEIFQYQKIRLGGGYTHNRKDFTLDTNLYGSTLWNGGYHDAGLYIMGDYRIRKPWKIDVALNPHYDTELGYQTCFFVGTSVNVHRDIALTAHYSTIPEYRESEKRVRIGAKLKVANLWVHPVISIPATKDTKNFRVLCSMRYLFN